MNATSSSSGRAGAPKAADPSAAGGDPALEAASLVAEVDAGTADRLASLGRLHQARLAHQQRSAADAAAVFGANSPQARAAQATVQATTTTVGRVQVVQRQAETPAPAVPSDGWVLHGRVYDATLAPRPHHTVYLVDGQNRYVAAHGYAYTDESGYFLLRQGGAMDATRSASNASASAGTTTDSGLFLAVADTDAQPVYLAASPFVPATGQASYSSITLAPGAKPIGDPPGAVRSVAIPPIAPKGTAGDE